MKQPAGSWAIRVAVKSLAGSLLLPANTGSSPAVRLQLTVILHARVFGWDLVTQTSKSCIDFNEFDVTMAREKWKKSHSNRLKPFKEALRPRDHCPSLFFIEVKERRGVEQPLDLCTTHHSVLRHIPRCTGKSGSYQPSSTILSHHQRSLSASQPGIPTQVTPLVDRGELKRQQSQILRLSMSQGTSKFCNSCNSAVA